MLNQIDPGYKNYQDPRLQPPEEPERETCGDCVYYREVTIVRRANGHVHTSGVCIFEVFQADTFAQLESAELIDVDPDDEPCRDYKEEK